MRPEIFSIRIFSFVFLFVVLMSASANANGTSGGDAAHGSLLFSTRCATCHFFDANKYGPSMHGLYGRKAGTVEGYDYSSALKASGIVWKEDTLDNWLINPSAMVPGTKMAFKVPSDKDRADIIAYLKTLALPNNK